MRRRSVLRCAWKNNTSQSNKKSLLTRYSKRRSRKLRNQWLNLLLMRALLLKHRNRPLKIKIKKTLCKQRRLLSKFRSPIKNNKNELTYNCYM